MAIKSVLGGDYSLEETSDEALVELARAGGSRTGAWDELYRRHAQSARGVARHLLHSRHDADDVVNDAFAGVIAAIGRGAGPHTNFRHYLMACVRNGCTKRAFRDRATVFSDPLTLDRSYAVLEDPEQFGETSLVAEAFSTLSTDWQRALWLTAVEERPSADLSRELGRRPGAVASLTFRAKEAFAEAYLGLHQRRVTEPSCGRIAPKLAAYVRGRAGAADTGRVERHLERCVSCTAAVDELRDVNSSLRTLALPMPILGTGTAIAISAPLVGAATVAGLGTWTSTMFGGAALAKVAALAALVVPAGMLITDSNRSDRTIRNTAFSASASASAAELATPSIDSASSDTVAAESTEPPSSPLSTAPQSSTEQSFDEQLPVTEVVTGTAESGLGDLALEESPSLVVTVPDRGVVASTTAVTIQSSAGTTSTGAQPTSAVTAAVPAITGTVAVVSIAAATTPATVPEAVPSVGIPEGATTSVETVATDAVPTGTVPAPSAPSTTLPAPVVTGAAPYTASTYTASTLPPIVATPLTVADSPLPTLPPLPLPKLPNSGQPSPSGVCEDLCTVTAVLHPASTYSSAEAGYAGSDL